MKKKYKALSYFMITLLLLSLLPLSALALSLQDQAQASKDSNTFYLQEDGTFSDVVTDDKYYGFCVDGYDFVGIKQSTWSLVWIADSSIKSTDLWNAINGSSVNLSPGKALIGTFSDSEYTVYKDDGSIYATYYVSETGGSNYLLAPADKISHFYYGNIDGTDPSPDTSYDITVKYVDENNEEIADRFETEGDAGSGYDVSAKDGISIGGYTYASTEGTLIGTLNSDIVIIVRYTTNTPPSPDTNYDITVKYVDENNEEIADRFETEGTAGSGYDVSAKDGISIGGYTYASTEGTLIGTLNSDIVIIVRYTTNTPPSPDTSYDITVKYVDENNEEIAERFESEGTAGSSYDVSAKDKISIGGYTYSSTDGTLSGTLNSDIVIIVRYTTNAPPSPPPSSNPHSERYNITIYYVDENGDQISNTYKTKGNEGTAYDVSEYDAIAIDGYTYDFTDGDDLSGQLHSDVEITVHYTTDATIDEGTVPGGNLPGDIDGDSDEEYNIDEVDVPGAGQPEFGVVDPSGNLPQTGTVAEPVNPIFTLGAIALLLTMSAAGLLIFSRNKKEEN